MNDLENVLVLSTALSQFIENANEEPDEEEKHQIALAQGMLDQVDAILANLGRSNVPTSARCICDWDIRPPGEHFTDCPMAALLERMEKDK